MTYATTLMDPPWPERGCGKVKRGADRHYPLMNRVDILHAIVRAPIFAPSKNAHAYIWVTNNYLVDGLWLMDALGFRYVTNIAWGKKHAGLGQYFRGKHELLLFGVKGSGVVPRTERRDLETLCIADHVRRADGGRKHSAKPPCFYELIEARSAGPYAELFARSQREGWASWGNEIEGGE